jgi:hypothetical protein
MRKILIVLVIVIVTMSILWFFAGRQISEFVDRFKTVEFHSEAVPSISYEGKGDGGILRVNQNGLDLAPLNPHVGSTKENQLALAYGGKVFAFGALTSTDELRMSANLENGDSASLSLRRSYIPWLSLEKGRREWRNNGYVELFWNKKNGATLKMIWLWPEIHAEAHLIRVEISDASR